MYSPFFPCRDKCPRLLKLKYCILRLTILKLTILTLTVYNFNALQTLVNGINCICFIKLWQSTTELQRVHDFWRQGCLSVGRPHALPTESPRFNLPHFKICFCLSCCQLVLIIWS